MLLVVVGNCQAESTRKLLMSTGHFTGERIAPVHELEAADMGWFLDLVARADVLVTQPIRDNYRGLPVGTRQLQRRRGAWSCRCCVSTGSCPTRPSSATLRIRR